MRSTLKSLTNRVSDLRVPQTVRETWEKREALLERGREASLQQLEALQTRAEQTQLWQTVTEIRESRERLLQTQNELQTLRLTHDEQTATVAQLKQTLATERDRMSSRIDEVVRDQSEVLVAGIATPLAQLAMQTHLAEAGQPVRAQDMVQVGKRLLTTLNDSGVTLIGEIGSDVPFDPTLHQPLMSSQLIDEGEPVMVRMAGVMYADKVLKKVGVTRSDSNRG